MCGRFVSARKRLELLEEFAAERDAVPADRDPANTDYNVAPTKQIYAVLDNASADEGKPQRELRLVRWGLVPSWAKDLKVGARMINARAETVATKPSFRSAFAKRRCLIPADGYYEWQTTVDEETGKKAKQPFYIYRSDGGILAFAGIYELWRDKARSDPQGEDDQDQPWLWTASIITTDAADEIGKIHDRTPMIVAPDDWSDWLDPANRDKDLLLATMHAAPLAGAGSLTSHPVSTAVNSVRNNGPDLIASLADASAGPRASGPAGPDAGGGNGPSLF